MLGVIGDLHLKQNLGYFQLFKDGREKERDDVLDYIVQELKDCDPIVLLGDQLNSRNNSSETLKTFVSFLKKFNGKTVYILGGNHEKFGDGRSALDFLKKLDKPEWKVITDSVITAEGRDYTFCPYFTKSELGVETNEEGVAKVMKMLPGGKILFIHHAISGSKSTSGAMTDIFDEIVLPRDELEKRYEMVIGGHIHKWSILNNTIVAGSVFNNIAGETSSRIWKIATMDMNYYPIEVPCRGIYKIENEIVDLSNLPKNSIINFIGLLVKAIINLPAGCVFISLP